MPISVLSAFPECNRVFPGCQEEYPGCQEEFHGFQEEYPVCLGVPGSKLDARELRIALIVFMPNMILLYTKLGENFCCLFQKKLILIECNQHLNFHWKLTLIAFP